MLNSDFLVSTLRLHMLPDPLTPPLATLSLEGEGMK